LSEVLSRYREFFALFDNFGGYVDFFLLQDLVEDDNIKFHLPFDGNWPTQPFPKSVEEYDKYISNTIRFVVARGERMTMLRV